MEKKIQFSLSILVTKDISGENGNLTTSMANKEPTKAITSPVKSQTQRLRMVSRLILLLLNTMHLPKNGTDKAISRVDTTKADLSMIMFQYFC